MINFHWKLCTRICNFLLCLFHAFRFAIWGYYSAKSKVSRSLLMEWALYFLCKKMRILPFKSTFGCFKDVVVYYLVFGFFGAILLFLRVYLAFFAYDYLATLLRRRRSGFSERQAHNCMLPTQWTWLLCSVSVISANKLSLQELTQLIRIKLLISRFPETFCFLVPISRGGGQMPVLPPFAADAHGREMFAKVIFLKLVRFMTLMWGSEQRPIWELRAFRCLKTPILCTQNDKAQGILCLFSRSVYQPTCSAFHHSWIPPRSTWTSRPAAMSYCLLLANTDLDFGRHIINRSF